MLEFDFRSGPSGVYLLFWKGEVIYVGKSTNVFQRISSHWNTMSRLQRNKRPYHKYGCAWVDMWFDYVEVRQVTVDRLEAEEQFLIAQHRPKFNKLLNRRLVPGLEKSAAILELRKKKLAEPTWKTSERLRVRRING